MATRIEGSKLPRALVYHDSFMYQMMPFLSEHFETAIYIRDPHVTLDTVKDYHPDIVIHECVERLLRKLIGLTDDLTARPATVPDRGGRGIRKPGQEMRGIDVNLQETLPLLRCPRSHTALSPVGDKLVSASGDEYPIVNGKPVLVRRILDWHVTPPREDKISQNIALFRAPKRITAADAIILHLGSGNVPSEDPRVISLDVLPCANVDLVAEAEELPFQDNSLDHVESGAVFEHLHDPWKAIAEIKRVLKPGGTFRIDTAFMQGYHGFPGHYYNMTPQAVETHLVGDFNLRDSFVPNSATPLMTIEMIITRYLGCVSRELRERLESMSLREFLQHDAGRPLRSRARSWPILTNTPCAAWPRASWSRPRSPGSTRLACAGSRTRGVPPPTTGRRSYASTTRPESS